MEWIGKLFKQFKDKKEGTADDVQAKPPVEVTGGGKTESAPPAVIPVESTPSPPPEQEQAPAGQPAPVSADTQEEAPAPGEGQGTSEQEGAPAAEAKADQEAAKIAKPQGALNKLLMIEGVTGVIVVSLDGFIIGSAGRTGADIEAVGVLASSEVSVAFTLAQEAQSGGLNQIIIEYSYGRVVLESLVEDLVLVVIGTAQSNLGMLRLAITNLKQEIIKSLSY